MLQEAAVVREKGTECVEDRVWDSVKRSICMIDTRWVFYERVSVNYPTSRCFHPLVCTCSLTGRLRTHCLDVLTSLLITHRTCSIGSSYICLIQRVIGYPVEPQRIAWVGSSLGIDTLNVTVTF